MRSICLLSIFFLISRVSALDYEMVKDQIVLEPQQEETDLSTDDLDRLTEMSLASTCMVTSGLTQDESSWVDFFRGLFSTKNGLGGTAFFISPDGHILTNKHVVENLDLETLVVVLSNGDDCSKASLIAAHPTEDVALLKIESLEGTSYPYLKLSPSSPAIGDWCFGLRGDAILYRNDKWVPFFYPSLGKILGIVPSSHVVDFLLISFQSQKGNSGSPIINFEGNVIGIVTGTPLIGSRGLGLTLSGQIGFFKEWVEDALQSDGYFGEL